MRRKPVIGQLRRPWATDAELFCQLLSISQETYKKRLDGRDRLILLFLLSADKHRNAAVALSQAAFFYAREWGRDRARPGP